MNLQEETERTENEVVKQIPSLTTELNGLGPGFRRNRLNLRFLCVLL